MERYISGSNVFMLEAYIYSIRIDSLVNLCHIIRFLTPGSEMGFCHDRGYATSGNELGCLHEYIIRTAKTQSRTYCGKKGRWRGVR